MAAIYARESFSFGDPGEYVCRGAMRDGGEPVALTAPHLFQDFPLQVPPLTAAEAAHLAVHPRGTEI
jgi:hypothetical protein